jgi:TIR domain/SIR2-like domain
MAQDYHATDPRISKELIQTIRQKVCILLAGPGLSRYVRTALGASPPVCWKDALDELITISKKNRDISRDQKNELDKLLSENSILAAGGKLQVYLKAKDASQSLLRKRLEEVMLCSQAKVGDVHLLLAQIPFCGYCTINYDRFIEDAHMQIYGLHPDTFNLTSIEEARQEYLVARKSKLAEPKFFLKLLGDVDHPASLNLGDRYLHDWLAKHPEKTEDLEDIFLDAPVLLIGFEPDSPDLNGLFANKFIFTPTPKPDQYYLMIEGNTRKSATAEKLQTIWYESESDLVKILQNIAGSFDTQLIIKQEARPGVAQQAYQVAKEVVLPTSLKNGPVHIFISWTREDEIAKEELLKHLNPLVRTNAISVWSGELSLGIGKNHQIEENLNRAELFLPLLSATYLSNADSKNELDKAVNQYHDHTIRLIPILLRACDWQSYFKELDMPLILPHEDRPIKSWEKPDQAYTMIIDSIKKVIEELRPVLDRQQKIS